MKHITEILILLVKIREDANVSEKHKAELNRCIRYLSKEIEQPEENPTPKRREKLKTYLLTAIHIITDFFNSI